MTKIFNPYPNRKDSKVETIRLSIDPSKEDTFLIRSVLMDFGAVHSALSMFHKHLANYVRTNNLTVSDRDKLSTYISSIFPDVQPANSRPATGRPNGKEPCRDERRGVESVHPTGEGQKNLSAVGLREQKATKGEKGK